jgi:hypothetical protein
VVGISSNIDQTTDCVHNDGPAIYASAMRSDTLRLAAVTTDFSEGKYLKIAAWEVRRCPAYSVGQYILLRAPTLTVPIPLSPYIPSASAPCTPRLTGSPGWFAVSYSDVQGPSTPPQKLKRPRSPTPEPLSPPLSLSPPSAVRRRKKMRMTTKPRESRRSSTRNKF